LGVGFCPPSRSRSLSASAPMIFVVVGLLTYRSRSAPDWTPPRRTAAPAWARADSGQAVHGPRLPCSPATAQLSRASYGPPLRVEHSESLEDEPPIVAAPLACQSQGKPGVKAAPLGLFLFHHRVVVREEEHLARVGFTVGLTDFVLRVLFV